MSPLQAINKSDGLNSIFFFVGVSIMQTGNTRPKLKINTYIYISIKTDFKITKTKGKQNIDSPHKLTVKKQLLQIMNSNK